MPFASLSPWTAALPAHAPSVTSLLTSVRESSDCTDGCVTKWKIIFAVVLFAEGLIFSHIVYLLKRATASSASKFNRIFHYGNALSGGVFFSTGVLHILPEAIALLSGEHGDAHGDEDGDEHGDEHDEDEEHHDERFLTLRQEDDHGEEEEGHSDGGFPWAFLILMLSFYVFLLIEKILLPKLLGAGHTHLEEEEKPVETEQNNDEESLLKEEESEEDPKEKVAGGFASRAFLIGFVEILGISAHSLFESMALGLSGNFTTVLHIFIATVAHRWATSSALAVKLVKKLSYFPFLVLMLLFSSFVPLGIGIGAALGSLSDTVQGVLFAISAGTFIYIGVFETMADEFVAHTKWPLVKFGLTLFGAAIITVITAVLFVLDIHG